LEKALQRRLSWFRDAVGATSRSVPRSVHRPWKPPVDISWISRSTGFAGLFV
jgi:hypothetical protein